jgi:outer membrane immunogenic protein
MLSIKGTSSSFSSAPFCTGAFWQDPMVWQAGMRPVLALAILLAMTAMAAAADYYAPAPFGPYSWAGPYLGATAGYEWGWVSNNPTQPSGVAGGIEGGYNWQRGNFVFGGEADISLSTASATVSPLEFSNPWFGTVRGRGGFAVGNVLIFGTAGVAYGELRADSGGASESHTNIGGVVGAGVEVGFGHNWSAKAEWLYLDLVGNNFALSGVSNNLTANLLRFGVNYRF